MELRYCLPGCRWSLCACVCVYVVYLCVCTCICLHVVYLFVLCICVYLYVYLCVFICVFVCVCVCVCEFVCLLASERDTLRGNTIENRGCLFIYIFGRTYVILYFDPHVFLCSLRVRPRPKLH